MKDDFLAMFSEATATTGKPGGDDTLDCRAIAEGLGLVPGAEGDGRDDEFVRHAVAFLRPTRETLAARVACFRQLVPLFMSRAPCSKDSIIERAAMHGFALAFADEMCGELCEDDDGGCGCSSSSSTKAKVPSVGVLCVAKKSKPGPLGSVSYIALVNKDAEKQYKWDTCNNLCLAPGDTDTATAARDGEKFGSEYEAVSKGYSSSASKTLEQVVELVVACFKQYSCRYAEDIAEFTELFPDISLWQSS